LYLRHFPQYLLIVTTIKKSELLKVIRECVTENWRRNLNRKDLNKILRINHVSGFTTDQLRQFGKKDALLVYNYIRKKMPWFMNYGYYNEQNGQWTSPLQGYFNTKGEDDLFLDWSVNFSYSLLKLKEDFYYWTSYPDFHNPHNELWKKRQAADLAVLKEHPTFEKELDELIEYVNELRLRGPDNPKFPGHYPLFVTLYEREKKYGGPEEGGWYYDDNTPIKSVEVKSYKEARIAAMALLKQMYDLTNDPVIYLEKIPNANVRKDIPHYS